MRRSNFTPFLFFLLLSIFLVSNVNSSPYYITRQTYFPSKSGSYITFDSSLLPLSFETLYRDSSTRWYFNETWITTTLDLSFTSWNLTGWLNYTVSGASTQYLYVSEPAYVQFDGVNQTEGDTWSYGSNTLLVMPTGTDISIFLGEGEEPEEPEEPEDPYIMTPIAGAVIQGEGFNIEVLNGDSLGFQSDNTLLIDVQNGFLNGTSGYLIVYDRRGELRFHAEDNSSIRVGSPDAEGSFSLTISGANSTTQTDRFTMVANILTGNNITISWSWRIISWVDNTMLALGFCGIILMVASPTWGVLTVRKKGLDSDSIERLFYAGFIFCVGFGLLVMWLWS